VIIHAVSIHVGGGKVLLDQILTTTVLQKPKILICDERYPLPVCAPKDLQIYRIKPSLIARWKAELLLKNISLENSEMEILCFSNLPPAFKLKSKVILFLQNALLLPGCPLYSQNLKTRLRILYEKLWLFFFLNNVNEIWVQTRSMKTALKKIKLPVLIKPIYPVLPHPTSDIRKKYDFISISGSDTHKRLNILLEAWELFGEKAPSLLLISDEPSGNIKTLLDKLGPQKIDIRFNVSREDIFKYYQESKCLIVTSKFESFCLPLYEARHFGLNIIGPDEPYVHDFGEVEAMVDMKDKHTLKESIERTLNMNFNKTR
jgi:glycosyltransferase involved in cell wall biosynthesis